MRHVWKLDEYGEVDMWALSYDWHNGPLCTVCDQSYCHWCTTIDRLDDCPGE